MLTPFSILSSNDNPDKTLIFFTGNYLDGIVKIQELFYLKGRVFSLRATC